MKRRENESYEDYKKRRAEDNAKTEKRLKGVKVWPGDWGTYIGDLHGKVEDKLKSMLEKMKNGKDKTS
jgi:hypothetical protein